MRGGNCVADEALAIGFGRADEPSGQGEVKTGPAEQPRKKIRAADVGQETNTDLRHAEAVPLACHAMRAVKADADAAAQHEAVDERHIRPDEFLEHPDMRIGGAVELAERSSRALLDPFMQDLEIAAAREHGRMRRLHHHAVDVRGRRPAGDTARSRTRTFPGSRHLTEKGGRASLRRRGRFPRS